MDNKEFNNFPINENSGFEDIISDSSMKNDNNGFDEIYSDTALVKKGKYLKHQRGLKGAIVKWWRRRKTWQKTAIITATSLVLVIAILLGVFLSVFKYNYNAITKDPEELGFENVIDKNIVNIALFGIDTRDINSFKGLSDSIMILSLNTVTKKVKIISIMRDTLVPITHNGKTQYQKINSAYLNGGPELAIKTLNLNFGLDISEYATVNFFGMVDIIDAVGGIEAELTPAEVKPNNPRALNACINEIAIQMGIDPAKHYISTPGKQRLNGIQAVAYARIRYYANIWGTNNDHGRTDRQRYVMEQLFNNALTLDKSRYPALVKSLIPCSETSLSYTEILGLAFDILLDSPTFEQTRMPLNDPKHSYEMKSPPNSKAGSVVYYDLDFAKELIHAFIYDDIPQETYIETNGVKKNDWYGKLFPYGSSSSGSSGSGGSSGNSGGSGSSGSGTTQTPQQPDNNEQDEDQTENDGTTGEGDSNSSGNSGGTGGDTDDTDNSGNSGSTDDSDNAENPSDPNTDE